MSGYYYGPVVSSWGDLKLRLERLLTFQFEKCCPTFDLDHKIPHEQLGALTEAERASCGAIEDYAIKLARRFRDENAEELSPDQRFFLNLRVQKVLLVVEAMTTMHDQAWKPEPLFQLRRSEWLLEQQTLWALIAYWEEFGRQRWISEAWAELLLAREKWKRQ